MWRSPQVDWWKAGRSAGNGLWKAGRSAAGGYKALNSVGGGLTLVVAAAAYFLLNGLFSGPSNNKGYNGDEGNSPEKESHSALDIQDWNILKNVERHNQLRKLPADPAIAELLVNDRKIGAWPIDRVLVSFSTKNLPITLDGRDFGQWQSNVMAAGLVLNILRSEGIVITSINSWYRSDAVQIRVNPGSPRSRHRYGLAIDINVRGGKQMVTKVIGILKSHWPGFEVNTGMQKDWEVLIYSTTDHIHIGLPHNNGRVAALVF